ncbi:hypothetical protein MPER_03440 [Moniliophthora perniciosa FA553]|nr:hypothetical protein MPER_03440 [Moniliophthora perniciosa FA553]
METGAVVCPNLEIFTCTECPPSYAASLLTLAEARSVPGGDPQSQHSSVEKSLKRMTVTFTEFIEDTDIPFKLESLRKKGMPIQWSLPTAADRPNSLDGRWTKTLSIVGKTVTVLADHIY